MDDISSYNGGKSPLGSSMLSESSESTSNSEDSNGDTTPSNQSLSSCPYDAAVAVAGSRAALKKRFFGTTQFAGLGIGDPAPPPANLMVTGAVVAMLVINTPVYVLRILVEECNSAHQWRSRNPFIPPPIPNAMRLGTARCRERLDRHLGPVGDVIPKAPVVVSRVFTSRTAEVCGHPADILRLEALLTTLMPLIQHSEPTRLLSISYAVFCLKKKNFSTSTLPPDVCGSLKTTSPVI
eukprot:TRINITY_DN13948_c0_g1_i2.p1 TRINITY_DN13948_c0_g1~~TRINITY_DN13948_c0_g1_i2.p1  ORF type:complete len:238 (+),score=44.84 TRINITY_DN13948_c0_g1_i2:874-1587(+)